MSRMDHAFSSPDCYVKFSGLFLTRLPRELSDDCELLLGNKDHKWGWKPFCFMDRSMVMGVFMRVRMLSIFGQI
ncbi:hypothetical protein NC651_016296 [Populus alba x Populus x berolinensis]|nr:hypothetical protein NC651_016296 [Populus alba x Populus x berolinensis]